MPRILVIDDDPTQRLITSTVLKSAGHSVLEAVDGEAVTWMEHVSDEAYNVAPS